MSNVCTLTSLLLLLSRLCRYTQSHPTVMISGTQPADSAASHLQSCDTRDDSSSTVQCNLAARRCFDRAVHLHGSVETPDRRVDEPSDDGVQHEGENLEKRI